MTRPWPVTRLGRMPHNETMAVMTHEMPSRGEYSHGSPCSDWCPMPHQTGVREARA